MKSTLFVLVGFIAGAAAVTLFGFQAQEEELADVLVPGPIQYNCELSGGTFESGACTCPIEEEIGQTQEMMYDTSKGFCQTTFGGPGGDAFWASMGLPWAHYEYYHDIINYWCEESGGWKSGAACICESGEYNKTTGRCE